MSTSTAVSARQAVLRSYRRVLKAALFAFQNDAPRIVDSFAAARKVYHQFAHLTDDADIRKMAAEGDDAAVFMRTSIVQGQYDASTKRLVIKVRPEHTNATLTPASDVMAGREGDMPLPPVSKR